MKLSELVAEAGVSPLGFLGDAEVTSISQDSRSVLPGALFVCNPGTTNDSHAYLADALAKGATAAVVWSNDGLLKAESVGLGAIEFPANRIEFNDAICRVCNTFYGYPTRTMKVIGVTGTNGKTTTAWLIRDMLQALGLKAGYLGTLGFQIPGEERELGNTTPFPVELWSLLAEARDKGVEALAMEVSSHALAEHRCEFVEFDAGVFTNLTQDHLDFHGSMEAYEAAKFRLFSELPKQTEKKFVGAINLSDCTGLRWYREIGGLGYDERHEEIEGIDEERILPNLIGEKTEVALGSVTLGLGSLGQAEAHGVAPLGGDYNFWNLLSASAGLLALRDSIGIFKGSQTLLDLITSLFSKVRPVPGRFEAVANDKGIGVLVDYAHTPDAIEKLLDAVRPLTQGKIITVFGCGGDRDRTKRPRMARAASERSDITVVTSDNPRTEDPQAILDEVLTGIVAGRESVDIIDRREAIAHAIKIANPGDVVVIAGKGHEDYQIIGRTKFPMDDRVMAKEALEAR